MTAAAASNKAKYPFLCALKPPEIVKIEKIVPKSAQEIVKGPLEVLIFLVLSA